MRKDPPRRRPGAVWTRSLSVIALVAVGAVAGSLLLWPGQVEDVLGLGADKAPVVSTVGAPAVGVPTTTKLVTPTPSPTFSSGQGAADQPGEEADDAAHEAAHEAAQHGEAVA
ncbi:hypothetical protein [Kribbella sp. NPDC048915]|uniref:hypothetical protein n=1 Tax=Kribbella sp. NPDC048915 TaxID=3155148 RepID=UPI0033C1A230